MVEAGLYSALSGSLFRKLRPEALLAPVVARMAKPFRIEAIQTIRPEFRANSPKSTLQPKNAAALTKNATPAVRAGKLGLNHQYSPREMSQYRLESQWEGIGNYYPRG